MRRSFSQTTLSRLREMPSEAALARLAIFLKTDQTYQPAKDATSRRWQVRTTIGEFEILTTGVKWYDVRAKKGGGGSIDLAMHVLHVPFVRAVQHLIADRPADG